MSNNITPAEVIETLSKIAREIDEQTIEIASLDEAAVYARAEYKVASARAFLTCVGSVEQRKNTAEVEVADLHLASELAEQRLRAATGAVRALRDRMEVGRSISALVKLDWVSS